VQCVRKQLAKAIIPRRLSRLSFETVSGIAVLFFEAVQPWPLNLCPRKQLTLFQERDKKPKQPLPRIVLCCPGSLEFSTGAML
jgi:hypothetical protein